MHCGLSAKLMYMGRIRQTWPAPHYTQTPVGWAWPGPCMSGAGCEGEAASRF